MVRSEARSVTGPKPKNEQILEGARAVFLEHGFEGTSIDAVARQAGVSKGTLYNHFRNKEGLFMAVVQRVCDEYSARLFAMPQEGRTVVEQLEDLAVRLPSLLLAGEPLEILRMAVAESKRFPEVGRVFYDAGPGAGQRRLIGVLAQGVAAGELVIDDLEVAAEHFTQLCYGTLQIPALCGVGRRRGPDALQRNARAAVRVFLAAYASASSPGR